MIVPLFRPFALASPEMSSRILMSPIHMIMGVEYAVAFNPTRMNIL